MELKTSITDTIKWDLEGSGEMSAVVENGKISNVKFCQVGNSPDACIEFTDEKHLRNMHKALTGLFAHLDMRRNGKPQNGAAATQVEEPKTPNPEDRVI